MNALSRYLGTSSWTVVSRPTNNKLRVLGYEVRAFPGLLPRQDFGKMMVREAIQG